MKNPLNIDELAGELVLSRVEYEIAKAKYERLRLDVHNRMVNGDPHELTVGGYLIRFRKNLPRRSITKGLLVISLEKHVPDSELRTKIISDATNETVIGSMIVMRRLEMDDDDEVE